LPIQKTFFLIFSFSPLEVDFILEYLNFLSDLISKYFPCSYVPIIFKRAKSSLSSFSNVTAFTISPFGKMYRLSLLLSSSNGGAACEHVRIYPFSLMQTAAPKLSEIQQRQLSFTFSIIFLFNSTIPFSSL